MPALRTVEKLGSAPGMSALRVFLNWPGLSPDHWPELPSDFSLQPWGDTVNYGGTCPEGKCACLLIDIELCLSEIGVQNTFIVNVCFRKVSTDLRRNTSDHSLT